MSKAEGHQKRRIILSVGAIVVAILVGVSLALVHMKQVQACPINYTLHLNFTGQGTVNLNPPNTNYTSATVRSYAADTQVTLTASSTAAQYCFDHWEGALTGSTSPGYVTMNAEKTVTAVFIQDTTPPTGTISINGGATYVNSSSGTLTLSASDANGVASMRFSNDNSNWSAWQTYATSKSWTFSSGDGAKTVYVQYKDRASNVSTGTISDTIIKDTTPPTGTISINSGAACTASPSVTLTLSASDTNGVANMQFSNEGSDWSPFYTYATSKSWTLSSGDGTKTVYARYKDNAGNWVVSGISDDITLDSTAPTAPTGLDLAAADDTGGSATDNITRNTSGLTISGTGAESGSTVKIKEGTTVLATGTAANFNSATGIDISLAAGTHSITATATDAAGNESAASSALSITLDTTAPTAPSALDLAAADDTGDSATDSVTQNTSGLTISGTGAETGSTVKIKEGTTVLATGTATNFNSTTGIDMSLTAGAHSITATATDTAGNESAASSALSITVDTTPPTGTVSINGGATYTTSTSVTLTLSASDSNGVASMQFSNDNSSWSSWEPYTTSKSWTLDSGDGIKTVYVHYRDAAGNVSTGTISDGIRLDTTPPTGTILINGGLAYASSSNVALILDVSDSACDMEDCQMQFSNDNVSWSGWGESAYFFLWTLSPGDGLKTVYVQYRDAAGNVTTETISDTITVETTPPTGTISINDGAAYSVTTSVILTLSATDMDSGMAQGAVQFSNDGTTWSLWEPYAEVKPWTLADGDGTKTVHVHYRDAAGNVSTGTIRDDIILDATPPMGSIVINGGSDYTVSPGVILVLSASDANGVASMRFSDDGVTYGPEEAYGASKSWTLPVGDGVKTVYVQYKDNLGNWSTATIADDIVVDTTPPTGTISINDGANCTASTSVTLTLWAQDAGAGMAQGLMQLSNDGATWSEWEPYVVSKPWTLVDGEAPWTVHARYCDAAGNVSIGAISDDISRGIPVTISATGAGTTNPPPGTYLYPDGDDIGIGADPEHCHQLDRWVLSGNRPPILETRNIIVAVESPSTWVRAEFGPEMARFLIRTYYDDLQHPAGEGVQVFGSGLEPLGETDAQGEFLYRNSFILAEYLSGISFRAIAPGRAGGSYAYNSPGGHGGCCGMNGDPLIVNIVMKGGDLGMPVRLKCPQLDVLDTRILPKNFSQFAVTFSEPIYGGYFVPLSRLRHVEVSLADGTRKIDGTSLFKIAPDGISITADRINPINNASSLETLRAALLYYPGEVAVTVDADAAAGFTCRGTVKFYMGKYLLDAELDMPIGDPDGIFMGTYFSFPENTNTVLAALVGTDVVVSGTSCYWSPAHVVFDNVPDGMFSFCMKQPLSPGPYPYKYYDTNAALMMNEDKAVLVNLLSPDDPESGNYDPIVIAPNHKLRFAIRSSGTGTMPAWASGLVVPYTIVDGNRIWEARTATCSTTGEFELSVPDQWSITINTSGTAPGGTEYSLAASVSSTANKSITLYVDGTYSSENTPPPATFAIAGTLQPSPSNSSVPVGGVPVDLVVSPSGTSMRAVTAANGSFTFLSVPAGTVQFNVDVEFQGVHYTNAATLTLNEDKIVTLYLLSDADRSAGAVEIEAGSAESLLGVPLDGNDERIAAHLARAQGGAKSGDNEELCFEPQVIATAGEVNNVITSAYVIDLPTGTQTAELLYRVTTEEYPQYVLSQSMWNDTWSIEVKGDNTDVFPRLSRNVNEQVSVEPRWNSSGSTEMIHEVLDVSGIDRLTLIVTATNIGDSLLPTTIRALITYVDPNNSSTSLKIQSLTPDTVDDRYDAASGLLARAATRGDGTYYSIPLQDQPAIVFPRTFDLFLDQAYSDITGVTVQIVNAEGDGSQCSENVIATVYSNQPITQNGPVYWGIHEQRSIRAEVTPSSFFLDPAIPLFEEFRYRFVVQRSNGITASEVTDRLHALWRLPDSIPLSDIHAQVAGGISWCTKRTYDWITPLVDDVIREGNNTWEVLQPIIFISREHAAGLGEFEDHSKGIEICMQNPWQNAGETPQAAYTRLLNRTKAALGVIAPTDFGSRASATASTLTWVDMTRSLMDALSANSSIETLGVIRGQRETVNIMPTEGTRPLETIAVPEGWAAILLNTRLLHMNTKYDYTRERTLYGAIIDGDIDPNNNQHTLSDPHPYFNPKVSFRDTCADNIYIKLREKEPREEPVEVGPLEVYYLDELGQGPFQLPADGTVKISATPQMPDVFATLPAPADPTAETFWRLDVYYRVNETAPENSTKFRDDYDMVPSVEQERVCHVSVGEPLFIPFDPAADGPFMGGTAVLHYRYGRNGQNRTFRFYIKAVNPTKTTVNAHYTQHRNTNAEYDWYPAVVWHETCYRQFNSPNSPIEASRYLPNYGYPDGWGMCQLDGKNDERVTTAELWDWRANLEEGMDRFAVKISNYSDFINAMRNHYAQPWDDDPDKPALSDKVKVKFTLQGNTILTHRFAEVIRRYNGLSASVRIGSRTIRSCFTYNPTGSPHRWAFVDLTTIPERICYVNRVLRDARAEGGLLPTAIPEAGAGDVLSDASTEQE